MEPARRPKQARGEARREHILRATLAAIGERGIEGVTHRAIAARARVPLGSLTYYFPSKEDLLGQALLLFVDEEVERLEALGERLGDAGMEPDEIAAAFATALEANDPVAQFELYLEASRTPALRGAAADCLRAYRRCAEIALRAAGVEDPERSASLFVALVDGLSLQRKAAPDAVPDLRDALLDLFGRVTAAR